MLRLPTFCLAATLIAQINACPQPTPPAVPSTPRNLLNTAAQVDPEGPAAADTEIALNATADGAEAFSWVQIGGPGVRLDNRNTANASFIAPSLETDSTLVFRVSVTNTAGDIGSSDVSIEVLADPNFGFDDSPTGPGSGAARPVARAGADQTVATSAQVTLDAAASTGRSLSYRWRQTSGPTVELTSQVAITTSFAAPASVEADDNQLVFELVVREPGGATARDTVAVRVRSGTDGGGTVKTRVRFETSVGNFTMELEDEESPNTVANFLEYVDDDFYDNTIIHRVVPGFVVQGGGFNVGLVQKTPRDPVDSEASNGLSNSRATVAMALSGGDPNSGTSQWFVNLVDNKFLDDQDFTVFARVIDGMDVVDRIAVVETTSRNGFDDVPVTDIIVRDVVREE